MHPAAGSFWRCLATGAAMLMACATGALGEPAKVRSGEHPGFSRLVIDFGVRPRWSISADGFRRSVVFEGPPRRLDTDGVFDRIGRERVRDVRASVNRLDVLLGCDCRVDAYALPGGRLVIDVGGRTETSSTDTPSEARPVVASDDFSALATLAEFSFEPAAPGAVLLRPPASWAPDRRRLTAAHRRAPAMKGAPTADAMMRVPVELLSRNRPGLTGIENTSAAFPANDSPREDTVPPVAGVPPLAIDPGRGRTAATDALTGALERAAAQGLIDLSSEPETTTTEDAPSQPPSVSQPLPLPLGPPPSLRVTTSIDRDLSRIARRLADDAGSDCLRDHDLDVASWGGAEDGLSSIADLRAGLYGEFDDPDPGAARALARRYIHLSFGAEALAVLAAVELPPDETAVLRFLAELADGRARAPGDRAASLIGCPGPAAMWGFLATPDPAPVDESATAEITGAFSGLPLHLRRHFGPVLVDRFLALGDPDTARTIWEAVDRAAGDHGAEFALASADLAMAEGDAETAERGYRSLEGAGPANAPRAVLRLLRSRLERGAGVDRAMVESAAALSHENRGLPISRELKLAELRGRIALDDWETVLPEIPKARFQGALGPSDADDLLAEFHIALAARGELDAFLRHGVAAAEILPRGTAGDAARRRLAARFLDLGLADRADRLLAAIAAPEPEDRLLETRAQLASGRFEAALAGLAGQSGTLAERLRAESLLGLGRFGDAATAFATAGDMSAAARAAARGGLWNIGPDDLRIAAADVLAPAAGTEEAALLAQNRTLANTAGALREDISALLEITRLDRSR